MGKYYGTKHQLYLQYQARRKYRPDFTRYEQLKTQWVADNPTTTPEQYQQAMREIADRCRI